MRGRWFELVRRRQEPIVITQRGRDAEVLVPVELYRQMESRPIRRIVSPRLVDTEDAARFVPTTTTFDEQDRPVDAGV
jgi:prevent-host-death family protein